MHTLTRASDPTPYGVTLVGEGGHTSPFSGPARFKLGRLIQWAGLEWNKFDHLELAEEGAALPTADELGGPRVVMPLGPVAVARVLHTAQPVVKVRGYPTPVPAWDCHAIPSVSPWFVQRGQSKYAAALVWDLQKAVTLAQRGLVVEPTDYTLDPRPREAYEWAQHAVAELDHDRRLRLAFDIETPGKPDDESEDDSDGDGGDGGDQGGRDRTWHIYRIGFAYKPLHALSVPWIPEYMAAIRVLLEHAGEKVVWNAGFDVPRVAAAGVPAAGVIHDGMVAWHILHSDLPKGLGFVATFTCPNQTEWKSLSGAAPALYNAIDADVEARSMDVIENELRANGIWDVYERDVLRLDPVLKHMSSRGMPVSLPVRLQSAIKLQTKQEEVLGEIINALPDGSRTVSPPNGFTREPDDTTGLVRIRVDVPVRRCDRCGQAAPTKPHFRTLKRPSTARPQNPCAGAAVSEQTETVERWARVEPWRPSRHALMRYQDAMGRPTPMQWDKKLGRKKPTMNEKAIKQLLKRHPADAVYAGVLEYRKIDKVAGTYIGRVEDQ